MSENHCSKCSASISEIGKCPVCDKPTDTDINLEELSAPNSGGNSSSSCCGYGCLIPIILVILMVTCGKSPKSNPPSSQQSTRPQISEPSSVQQSPPEPEPQSTVQVRPSATHTNDPVCRACGMNHLRIAQPIAASSSVSSSANESRTSAGPSSQTGDSWDEADFLR